MNSKILKNSWTIILIIFGVFIHYYVISSGKKKSTLFYENELSGVIENIHFGDKKQVIVTIKKKKHSLLMFGIRKGVDINIGDSLYKAPKSRKLELHSKSANGGFIFTEIYQMK